MEHTLMTKHRSIHRLILFSSLLTGIGLRYAAAAGAPAYTIKDLGTLGGTFSTGLGINAAGQVTGNANTNSGESHVFLYDGAMHDLGTLGGTSSAGWGDINDSRYVTGGASTNSGDGHAFLYDGAMHDLGTLGGSESEGRSINNSNHITGI